MKNEDEKEGVQRLSFSGYKTWKECPFKYRLDYIENAREPVYSIYLDFGSAVHKALEYGMINKSANMKVIFINEYDRLVTENRQIKPEAYKVNDKEWKVQGVNILDQILDYFNNRFPNYEVISTEEDLYIPIKETDWYFKGYVDIVICYKNKFYIIDYKSTTWGWNKGKRRDDLVSLQVQLYKNFWCQKHDIETKLVNPGFMLLKRTPKNDNIEFIQVSGSPAKLTLAEKSMRNAIASINKGLWLKNRFSCKGCDYAGTELCP